MVWAFNQSISVIVRCVSPVVMSKATGLRIASGFQSKRILGLSFDSIFHHWKASMKCLCDPKKEKSGCAVVSSVWSIENRS